MAQPIRVAVANQPRLMRELVLEAIIDHPDIEIVAEIQNEAEIVETVDGIHPDVLIIALDKSDKRPPICDVLLRRHPEMRILALAPERNSSIFYWGSFAIHESSVEASEAGILDILRRKGEHVGLATVYRHLQALSEQGSVDAIRDASGELLYRQCGTTVHHHHLTCRQCGHSVEVEGRAVEQWAARVATEAGFTDVGHTVELFGLCPECAS